MDALFKDVLGIFKFVQDFFKGIQEKLWPKKAYSWQMLIYLSVFSWALSFFATAPINDMIAFCGWLFLIAGTAWYTTDDPLRVPGTFMPVGAVITGFLLSVFALGNEQTGVTPGTIVFWPTFSALITAIPEFFEGTGTDSKAQIPKPEARQKLLVLVGSCMLLSCWINLYFVTNNWAKEYPTSLSDNFQGSTLVIRVEPPNKNVGNGAVILDRIEQLVEQKVSKQPWSQVEKWLQNAKKNLDNLKQIVMLDKRLKNYEEKELWRIEPRISTPNPQKKDEYTLDIFSIWTGPSSNPRGYYLKKSCQIRPIADRTKTFSTNKPDEIPIIAEIECGRISKPMIGPPPPQR
ncbi:MAG: septal junction protein FraD [Gloeotrichia echinulata IR180]|jgi:hypothetical protein